jgi:hypothetical protein
MVKVVLVFEIIVEIQYPYTYSKSTEQYRKPIYILGKERHYSRKYQIYNCYRFVVV